MTPLLGFNPTIRNIRTVPLVTIARKPVIYTPIHAFIRLCIHLYPKPRTYPFYQISLSICKYFQKLDSQKEKDSPIPTPPPPTFPVYQRYTSVLPAYCQRHTQPYQRPISAFVKPQRASKKLTVGVSESPPSAAPPPALLPPPPVRDGQAVPGGWNGGRLHVRHRPLLRVCPATIDAMTGIVA